MQKVLETFADIFNENLIFISFEEFPICSMLLLNLFITVWCLVTAFSR